jgi:hypothetical protein|tara:strand:+ start:1020 stop:1178 length:159 start_codon:yes stop_codon:yes gene_type:complete
MNVLCSELEINRELIERAKKLKNYSELERLKKDRKVILENQKFHLRMRSISR